MAYEYGIATSAADLLDKIRVVALARGWTVDNDSNPSATSRRLSLHVGDAYFHLVSETANASNSPSQLGPWIYGMMSTGYSGAADYLNQPGTANIAGDSNAYRRCMCNNLVGPFTSYRIFSGANYIHTVIETSPNVFSHIAIGVLNKYGTYTGGGYMSTTSWYTSSSSNSYPDRIEHCYLFDMNTGLINSGYRWNSILFRGDIDGKTWFYNMNTADPRVLGFMRTENTYSGLNNAVGPMAVHMARTPNAFNLVSPLLPAVLHVARGSGLYSPLGEIPDLRAVNMTYLNAGDELTIGADTWIILPAKSASFPINTAGAAVSSGTYGYAYKKVM